MQGLVGEKECLQLCLENDLVPLEDKWKDVSLQEALMFPSKSSLGFSLRCSMHCKVPPWASHRSRQHIYIHVPVQPVI